MKLIILVACALVAIAAAGPVEKLVPQILRSEFDQEPEGGYKYAFESDDGVQKAETGEIKEVLNEKGEPQNVVVVRGSYSYIDSEGVVQSISYIADEQGFRAEGPSIPKNE